jgi:zinc/manganese transport system substrate-binding protein
MLARRHRLGTVLLALTMAWLLPARVAAAPVKVVATFSVLADMVREVGGERVTVTSIVGPDGDAHVYEPTPLDAKAITRADLLVVNGLGFEGWLERLAEAAGYGGPIVVASTGIVPRAMADPAAGVGHGHDHGAIDPHAWQSLANGGLYVANIVKALQAVDPEGAAIYEDNGTAYRAEIAALDRELRAAFASLPEERRRIVTSHDAFGYFADTYGIEVIAPQGVSTESEASAADVARLIRQIHAERIPAVFVENVTDPRLVEQIGRETEARVGGSLYSDALSSPEGPAPTYLAMFRHNLATLLAALTA